MSDNSKIEWTDASWNPVTGCTEVSPGCDHCYAKTFAERWRGVPGHHFERGFDVVLRPERLDQPLRWRRPRRVFVNSMSDLFHESIPDSFIHQVFAVMAATPQHTYQILTKRHARMRSLLRDECRCGKGHGASVHFRSDMDWVATPHSPLHVPGVVSTYHTAPWPLPNVWIGVSVEDQKWADIRIPALLDTPAAVRWLSCEPLLGPVDLELYVRPAWGDPYPEPTSPAGIPVSNLIPPIDWVVVGGESGPGARPMHPDWARGLRDQCTAASVPYFFKQWGEWAPDNDLALAGAHTIVPEHGEDRPFTRGAGLTRLGKKRAGRELDGRNWDEYPR